MRSGNAEEKVLDDISLNIEAGQKMGICGRTGRSVYTYSSTYQNDIHEWQKHLNSRPIPPY